MSTDLQAIQLSIKVGYHTWPPLWKINISSLIHGHWFWVERKGPLPTPVPPSQEGFIHRLHLHQILCSWRCFQWQCDYYINNGDDKIITVLWQLSAGAFSVWFPLAGPHTSSLRDTTQSGSAHAIFDLVLKGWIWIFNSSWIFWHCVRILTYYSAKGTCSRTSRSLLY